jgi:protein-S-isoprenylcysteine O-methyltransferase Ste14
MRARLVAKALLATVVLPGVVAIAVPYSILRWSGSVTLPGLSPVTFFAAAWWAVSAVALLHSIWAFAAYGHGTLAPVDPPRVLVVRGLYRYTRNPMYLAVLSSLLAAALCFRSAALLLYAFACGLCFHLFVLSYEEPALRAQFGASFERYARAVPRWGITTRPYRYMD